MRASDHKSCLADPEYHEHCHPASRCLPTPSLQVEAGRVGHHRSFQMDVPGGTEGGGEASCCFEQSFSDACSGPVKGDLNTVTEIQLAATVSELCFPKQSNSSICLTHLFFNPSCALERSHYFYAVFYREIPLSQQNLLQSSVNQSCAVAALFQGVDRQYMGAAVRGFWKAPTGMSQCPGWFGNIRLLVIFHLIFENMLRFS